jgi:TPR repeat protein
MPKVKLPRKLRDLAKTANGGCGEAAWTLARHFFYGTGGVEKNEELERQWLEKGAELGDVNAQVNFGMMLDDEGDYEGARKWWELAAAQGNAIAMSNIAQLYSNGEGVEKNKSTAAEWFLKAASTGDREAQLNYGLFLDDEMGQYAAAREWYEKAAAQGDYDAMNNLGQLYDNGRGVERNKSTAAAWYLKGALKGNPCAQNNYGAYLELEREQYANALKWYERAAACGNEDSMCNIGLLYDEGRGVERNIAKAREWWEQAVEQGCQKSETMLKLTHTEAAPQPIAQNDYVAYEKMLLERSKFSGGGSDYVSHYVDRLGDLWTAKREALLSIMEDTSASISDDAMELFASGPLPDHKAEDRLHHLALCFLHGRCGLEKNLRMAKEAFKLAEIYHPDNAAVAEELVKLRACVTCGKRDARLGCKLCRGVRYCDKRCQQKDWARGIEPHPPHRETCSRAVNGIMPPGYFARLRDEAAKEREASN